MRKLGATSDVCSAFKKKLQSPCKSAAHRVWKACGSKFHLEPFLGPFWAQWLHSATNANVEQLKSLAAPLCRRGSPEDAASVEAWAASCLTEDHEESRKCSSASSHLSWGRRSRTRWRHECTDCPMKLRTAAPPKKSIHQRMLQNKLPPTRGSWNLKTSPLKALHWYPQGNSMARVSHPPVSRLDMGMDLRKIFWDRRAGLAVVLQSLTQWLKTHVQDIQMLYVTPAARMYVGLSWSRGLHFSEVCLLHEDLEKARMQKRRQNKSRNYMQNTCKYYSWINGNEKGVASQSCFGFEDPHMPLTVCKYKGVGIISALFHGNLAVAPKTI